MTTMLDRSMPFGQQLKRLRSQFDLTQEALAELANCSVQTIRFFESGRRRPSLEMAEHLATLLRIPQADRADFVHHARMSLPSAGTPDAGSAKPAAQPMRTTAGVERYRPPLGTPLIGREGELNVLRMLFEREGARLVTLLGNGGMGKTQLALTTAHALAETFTDGAIFVPLASLQHAHQLPGAVADALGMPLQGVRDTQQQVTTFLETRQLLLVLDNFEHLLRAGAETATQWVRSLLRLPELRLLITSRERLRLSGERVFELGGLTLPQEVRPPEHAGAVLLFVERAAQVDADFTLNHANQAVIHRICQLVDGMPLALELAATWVRTLSCQEIVEELARSIDFLVLADRDMPPRHHSMRAVFDHSWALLTAEEQRVLAELSVFQGGCGRAAATDIVRAPLLVLAALIDKSLVRRAEDAQGQARYDLHELTRQYAAQQLAVDPARQRDVHTRHAVYYAELVARQGVATAGAAQLSALAQIEQEVDNLRSAWSFALVAGLTAVAQAMIHGLGELFLWRSRYHEGLTFFQEAAVMLRGQSTQAADWAYLACQIDSWRGCFSIQIGQVTDGEHFFADIKDRLAQLAAAGHDVSAGEAMLLGEYALFLFITVGDYAKALALQEAAVANYRRLGNEHFLAKHLVRLSQILHFLGRYAESIAYAEEAIALAQRANDRLVLIGARERLALILTYQGHFAAAEPYFRGALADAEATRQPAKVASVLTNLGVVLTFSGRFVDGQTTWRRALAYSKAVDDHNYIVHDTILLGFAALHLGNYAEATALAQAGIVHADQLGYARDGALGYLLWASAQLAQGELAVAQENVETAIARYRTIDHPDELSWAMAVQLYILHAQDQRAALPTLATTALATLRNAEGFNAVQTLLPILALLLYDRGEITQAVELTIALRQSPFIQQSAWFAGVVDATLQAHIDRLPAATQAYVAAEVAAGDARNGQLLLRQVTFL